MRLTPKHVGMEIKMSDCTQLPWEVLKGLKVCTCGATKQMHYEVLTTGVYCGFSSATNWLVRKPQKKGKGRK